jgi:hypothetical protein
MLIVKVGVSKPYLRNDIQNFQDFISSQVVIVIAFLWEKYLDVSFRHKIGVNKFVDYFGTKPSVIPAVLLYFLFVPTKNLIFTQYNLHIFH